MDLVRGQKLKLADVGLESRLSIGLRVAGPALEYDLSVFGLIDGKLEDDRYFVFFNNKQSPEGAIAMRSRSGDEQLFDLDVAKLPTAVSHIDHSAGGYGRARRRISVKPRRRECGASLPEIES